MAPTWLPGPMRRAEKSQEGTSAVIKKPRARPKKNVPEPCRLAVSVGDFFLPASQRKRCQREVYGGACGCSEIKAAAGAQIFNGSNRKRPTKKNSPPIVCLEIKAAAGAQIFNGSNKERPTKKNSPPIVEEASATHKLAAEEDARRSAGKPLHPFFAQKIPEKHQFYKEVDSKVPVTFPKPGGLLFPCPPLHVTQFEAPECIQLDWGKLRFVDCCKRATESCNWSGMPEALELCRQGGKAFPDLDHVIGHFSSIILSPDQVRWTRADDVATGRGGHQIYAPEQIVDQLLRYSRSASLCLGAEIGDFFQASGLVLSRTRLNMRTASFKDRKISVQEGTSADNFLWTDVYKPRSPEDVCGNKEDLRFLNDWLGSWQKKILSCRPLEKLDSPEGDGIDDESWFQEDCSRKDASDCEEELINTLLLTGPIGCGKTAAVYACARAQGFSVIEVSTADCRNGAVIRKKFGEALESHRLQTWSAGIKGDGKQPGPLEDHDRSQKHELHIGLDDQELSGMSKRLTVMLFEDVDVVFDEDQGFSSALAKLAAASKRPIILTSNKRCPALPVSLVKLTREFKQPCTGSLVLHACMASAAEGSCCCPKLVECVVKECQHDMRQVMMMLQFWSQRRRDVGRRCVEFQVREERNRVALSHGYDIHARGSTTLSQIQAIHLPGCTLEDQYSDESDPPHPVLLPLSFPSSLLWHVARKVSEAAWHLHLCASFAEVISNQELEVAPSLAVQYGTNPSLQKWTKLEAKLQATNVGGAASDLAIGEIGLSVSVKSPKRGEALAHSESQDLQQHGTQSATLAIGRVSCCRKIAAEDSVGGHLCADELDRPTKVMIRCGAEACDRRSSAAEVNQSSKAIECTHSVQVSSTTGKAAPVHADLKFSGVDEFPSATQVGCTTPRCDNPVALNGGKATEEGGKVPSHRKRRLHKVRDLEISQHTVRKSGSSKLTSGILMGCNPCEAVCEKQEHSRERQGEVTHSWTPSLDEAQVHSGLKSSCVELPSATQDRILLLWCDKPSAQNEDNATELRVQEDLRVAPRRRLRLCTLRHLKSSQSRTDAERKNGIRKPASVTVMEPGAERTLSRERQTQIGTESLAVAEVHPALKGSYADELPSGEQVHRSPIGCGEPLALREGAATEIHLEEDREVAPRSRRKLATCQSSKEAIRKNSPMRLISGNLMECSPCGAVCEELSRERGSEVTQTWAESLEVALLHPALKGSRVFQLPTTQEHRNCDEASAVMKGEATEVLTGTVGKTECRDIQSCASAMAVVATMARLLDDMSLFDRISSYSASELQSSPSAEGQYGFHSELMEVEAAYIADCSVGLCLHQCSRLVALGSREKQPERLQAIESGLGSLDWLGSDVNPCGADHNIRRLARRASLKNIVSNVLPKRTKAVAMSAALYDYTAGLARICRLEESRKAGAVGENGIRRGRRFCHYLANSLGESEIACLVSHSQFGRGSGEGGKQELF